MPTVVESAVRSGQSTTKSTSSPLVRKLHTPAGALPFIEFPSNVRVPVFAFNKDQSKEEGEGARYSVAVRNLRIKGAPLICTNIEEEVTKPFQLVYTISNRIDILYVLSATRLLKEDGIVPVSLLVWNNRSVSAVRDPS
jgi:hypothetical protein